MPTMPTAPGRMPAWSQKALLAGKASLTPLCTLPAGETPRLCQPRVGLGTADLSLQCLRARSGKGLREPCVLWDLECSLGGGGLGLGGVKEISLLI